MSSSTDSKWDTAPVYLVFAAVNLFFLLAWIFNFTDFGHNAHAAGTGWHIIACLLTVGFWYYTYILAADKVDGSKGLSVAVFVLLFALIPFTLCGFTFSIAS